MFARGQGGEMAGRRMGTNRVTGTFRKSHGAGLMRALLACCLTGLVMGLSGEAPWGDAWSDSAGVLATSFAPLSIFYTCSVRNLAYSMLAACNAACTMGESRRDIHIHNPLREAAKSISCVVLLALD